MTQDNFRALVLEYRLSQRTLRELRERRRRSRARRRPLADQMKYDESVAAAQDATLRLRRQLDMELGI